MPRRPRLALADVPVHVIQRGNNRSACFFADEDRRRYLDWLREYAVDHACRVHAYVLMTNHVHLLLTPGSAEATGRVMKALGQRYVQYVNRVYGRSGTLWEGRFRSCLVDSERYFLVCQLYIELNPVRAGMVACPDDHRWSSYACNAGRSTDPCVDPHPAYLALGNTVAARGEAYRALVAEGLNENTLGAIREATNGNFALGNEQFGQEIAEALGRRAVRGRPGRPGRPDGRDAKCILI